MKKELTVAAKALSDSLLEKLKIQQEAPHARGWELQCMAAA